MQISAPIYQLKRQAKLLARRRGIPLNKALNQCAKEEGYQSWSHLAASYEHQNPAQTMLSHLNPGDFILVGARPGHGKTLLALEMAFKAAQLKRRGYFFTLDYNERDVADGFAAIGANLATAQNTVVVDTSDEISASYIIERISAEQTPAFIVIDYLQLLDQKRSNPDLDLQMSKLRRFTTDTGAICAVISQIDRQFDLCGKPMPDASDVRLPNPVDLSVFDKLCFLHEGKIRMDQAA